MFRTLNLEVKKWTLDQTQDFFELSQDEGFNLFPITKYRQESLDTARVWIKDNVGKYSVTELKTNRIIGMGGLTPWNFENESMIDITYRLRESAWGRGLGMELAQGLKHYAFHELGLNEITATITPDNIGSIKIAKRLGMNLDRRIMLLGVPTDLFRLQNS